MSINQLEEKAELSKGSTYKWNVVSPSVKNLKKVADVLECTVNDLIGQEAKMDTYDKYAELRDKKASCIL